MSDQVSQRAPRNVFVEFHALVSHAPSNLNRDDLGSPKSATFGGVRRLRISSQCLKREWRMSEWFRGAVAEDRLGVRTNTAPQLVLDALAAENVLGQAAQRGLLALFASLGKKTKSEADDDDDAADDESEASPASESTSAPTDVPSAEKAETAHLLFLTKDEIEALKAFAREEVKELEKVYTAKPNKAGKPTPPKLEPEAVKKLRGKLKKYLAEHCVRNAVDVALFGRFLTSDEFAECDAAMQVAHALGTEPADITYDYFTAVDDRTKGAGAGHLGETELAASVFYKYAVCDVRSLAASLTRKADGEPVSKEDRELAATALGAMAQAIARVVPAGKKNSTAPQSPADYLEVVVRRNAPISLVNAFLRPVTPPGGERDVMDESIKRLRQHAERYEKGYSEPGDVMGRFVLSFRDLSSMPEHGVTQDSFKALAASVAGALTKALA